MSVLATSEGLASVELAALTSALLEGELLVKSVAGVVLVSATVGVGAG